MIKHVVPIDDQLHGYHIHICKTLRRRQKLARLRQKV